MGDEQDHSMPNSALCFFGSTLLGGPFHKNFIASVFTPALKRLKKCVDKKSNKTPTFKARALWISYRQILMALISFNNFDVCEQNMTLETFGCLAWLILARKSHFFGNIFWATLLPFFGVFAAQYVLWNWKVKTPSFL